MFKTAKTLPCWIAALVGIGLGAGLLPATSSAQDDSKSVDYLKQIKPILAEHCYSCHGPETQESGLRLDAGKLMLRGGNRGPALQPKSVKKSPLLMAIMHQGDVEAMPPDDELEPKQIELIRRWIEQGARFPADEKVVPIRLTSDHWAFKPIKRSRVPVDVGGGNPIDAFVLARLKKEGISPSSEADRLTLLRRLTLDLLGLPPTTSQLQAFLNDRRPGAYQRLVDRILASPGYGERWGRHWLDLARYADSNGFTIDGARTIWPYRDWVIDAINRDLPFDQFSVHQLAGDMLPTATPRQIVATGFHRNTLINQEGGTNDEEFRVESVVDRVNTTGSVFLGLTVGCAQCHKHKYDPITQRDFYRLFAIFNNTEDSNDASHATGPLGPLVSLPTPTQTQNIEALSKQIAAAQKSLSAHDATLRDKQVAWEKSVGAAGPAIWQPAELESYRSMNGAQMKRLSDQSILVGGKIPDTDAYELVVKLPQGASASAFRLEALTHESLPKRGPGLTKHGNFTLSEFEVSQAGPENVVVSPTVATSVQTSDATKDAANKAKSKDVWKRVPVATAFANRSQEKGDISNAIDGNLATFWGIYGPAKQMNADHEATFVLKKPISGGQFVRIVIRQQYEAPNYAIGRFRLTWTKASPAAITLSPAIRKLVAIDAKKRTSQQQKQVRDTFLSLDGSRKSFLSKVSGLKSQLASVKRSIVTSMVMSERKTPRETFIHIRGDFLRKGAKVTPGVPSVLPTLSVEQRSATRLDLAQWLFTRENPLTARVTVNRHWQRFFGRGIVDTENDFGTQGSRPSHPELLDWLASELMRRDWSLKSFHRLIVTSATYRQASTFRAELGKRDPQNRLLARQSRIRLEAEVIRDVSLASAGILSTKMKGPGVYPPQPRGIYVLTQNKKGWDKLEDRGDDRFRRGLYTYFWRSSPYPLLPTFDAPDANTTCTRRPRSNTPLQALTLANDAAFVEFAQYFARRIMAEDDGKRMATAFQLSLSRPPSGYELSRLQAFFDKQLKHYRANPEEASKMAGKMPHNATVSDSAAWTAVARVLMNLDEFITRE